MSKKKVPTKGQASISKYFTEKPTIKAPKVTKDEEKTEKELESAKKIQDQLDQVNLYKERYCVKSVKIVINSKKFAAKI